MSFLDHFTPELWKRLLEGGAREKVVEGDLLIRRGEPGRDLFFIEHGTFEVVDSRSNPEIVLHVAGAGSVIGEMAFVDDASRGADVRAAEDGVVMRWSVAETRTRFEIDPTLAAAFYRAVAMTLSERFRTFSHTVAAGGLSVDPQSHASTSDAAQARLMASKVLGQWVDADERLRKDPNDRRGRDLVRSGIEVLFGEVSRWLSSLDDDSRRQGSGTLLSRELRPYLVRSVTGERTLDPLGQAVGDPRLLAHILRGEAEGSGAFGMQLDACLLDLPTMRAIRARSSTLVRKARSCIPDVGLCDLMVANPNCGASLAGLLLSMSEKGGRVRVIDSNRGVLSMVDAGLPRRPPNVSFSFEQVDLVDVVTGRLDIRDDLHHIVILDSIVDHLPDRLVVSLAEWATAHLRPGGILLATGLTPSPDALVVDHVLGWPLVRRTSSSMAQLFATRTQLNVEVVEVVGESAAPGSVVCVELGPDPSAAPAE